jgi:chromosomal replication initiator protein
LYIQVPSKFFYEWLEEHYVKLLKVLTKELGKNAKLLYKIKMETLMAINNRLRNNYQALTVPMKPQNVDAPQKNLDPELKNPFVIPGIEI